MQLVILIGVQATGKSSFCRRQFQDTHIRLNLDMLRTRHRETILLDACLAARQPVVMDNTNPTRMDRARYIEPARKAGFSITGYFFESRLADAIRRNSGRAGARRIPERGIRGTSGRLELPVRSEGFDKLYFVRLIEDSEDFEVQDWLDEI